MANWKSPNSTFLLIFKHYALILWQFFDKNWRFWIVCYRNSSTRRVTGWESGSYCRRIVFVSCSIKILAFPPLFSYPHVSSRNEKLLYLVSLLSFFASPILLFSALFRDCNSAIVICSSLKATQNANENGRKLEREEEVDGLSLSLATEKL